MQNHNLKTVFTSFLLLFALACQNKPGEHAAVAVTETEMPGDFTVSGTIRGSDSGWVYFSRIDTLKAKPSDMDSVKMVNGTFEFKGRIDHARPYYIGLKHLYKAGDTYRYSGIMFNKVLFIEPGKLNISGQRDSLQDMITSGGKAQAIYDAFERTKLSLSNKINKTYGQKLTAESKKLKSLDSITTALNGYYAQLNKIVTGYITKHPNSHVSAYIAYIYLTQAEVNVLKPAYEAMSANVQNSYLGKEVLKIFQASARTAIGSPVPDFAIPDPAGKKSGPSAFRGQYVLVDFWASWCAPCRTENPNLLKAYKRFQQKGFEILSVSMDDNRAQWLHAVKQDKLPWTQLSDLKGKKSSLRELYGINSIPANFLVDRDGKIIARNLRGGDVEKKLEEVIGK